MSHLVDAQLLAIMTDVEGLFSEDPTENPDAELIPFVRGFSKGLYDLVGSTGSALSRGGMRTKLRAAETAAQGGRMTLIANGQKHRLAEILDGEDVGTLFVPGERSLTDKKIWLAHSRRRGAVVVDDGAAEALVCRGKSLLPSGVVEVVGDFEAGDLIGVERLSREEIARGQVRFSSAQVLQVLGKQTTDVADILAVDGRAEVIHRDDMVVFQAAKTTP